MAVVSATGASGTSHYCSDESAGSGTEVSNQVGENHASIEAGHEPEQAHAALETS